LLDIVPAIRKAAEELHAADRVQVALLEIQNEPIAAANCIKPNPGSLATPFEILDQLRQARSKDFPYKLRRLLTEHEKNLLPDSLRPVTGDAEFPLAWTISLATQTDMYVQTRKAAGSILSKRSWAAGPELCRSTRIRTSGTAAVQSATLRSTRPSSR
jgi:hypothetical protein